MLKNTLTFIRFSHTIFALPFALGAMLVAANGLPSLRDFFLILLAMVFARTAAMTFNRLADWKIDQRNPRTADRHKLISRGGAIALLAASAAAFVATSAFINPLCFALSPAALVIVFFYSLTKRFTSFTHLFLGLALGISPIGAWLSVTGRFALPPFVLAAGVLCWVAGFDLIYASQDYEFDKNARLNSLVVRLGIAKSLKLSQFFHAAFFVLLILFGVVSKLGAIYFASLAFVLGALIYEHRAVKRLDVNAINAAFFNSNAFVGSAFIAGILFDRLLK